jgi:hypothetical protein
MQTLHKKGATWWEGKQFFNTGQSMDIKQSLGYDAVSSGRTV